MCGGTQVLANGDNVDAHTSKVNQSSFGFFKGFAHSHNETRFCREVGSLGTSKHRQRACIASTRAHRTLQPCHRFDVVVQNIGLHGKQNVESIGSLHIGNESFNTRQWRYFTNCSNTLRHVQHAAIG